MGLLSGAVAWGEGLFMTEYQQKQLRKSIYIPKCCRGEYLLKPLKKSV